MSLIFFVLLTFTLFIYPSSSNASIIAKNGTTSSPSLEESKGTTPTRASSTTESLEECPPDPTRTDWMGLADMLSVVRPSVTAYQYNGPQFRNPYMEPDSEPNASLQSFCGSAFNASLTKWLKTAPITQGYIHTGKVETVAYDKTTSVWSTQQCVAGTRITTTHSFVNPGTTYTVSYNSGTDYNLASDFSFTASSPCCGKCHVTGGEVQVYFWPTSTKFTNASHVATLTNKEGFEFVSPTVYVAFNSLYASDLCGTTDPGYKGTTIAFTENELSTAIGYTWDTARYAAYPPYFGSKIIFTAATWGTVSCTDIVESFWQYDLLNAGNYETKRYPDLAALSAAVDPYFDMYSANSWIHQFTVTHNPCSPTISVPTQLYTMNPVWSSCGNDLKGLFDPPYTLTSGAGLSGPTTVAAPVPVIIETPTTTAAAGPSPTPNTPTMTPTPVVVPPTPAPVEDPPISTPVVVPPTPAPVEDPPASTTIVVLPQPAPVEDPSTSTPGRETPPTTIQDPAPSPPEVPSPQPNIPSVTPVTAITIGTQTVSAGGPAITVSNTIISIPSHGSSVIINGTPQPVSVIAPVPTPTTPDLIIGTQTLAAGGPAITISNTIISLASDGSSAVINGTPQPVSVIAPTAPAFRIGSQTLVAGAPAITISDTKGQGAVSLDRAGKSVVVGSKTIAVNSYLGSSATSVVEENVGGFIASVGGFVGPDVPSSPTVLATGTGAVYPSDNGTVLFLGDARSLKNNRWLGWALLGMGIGWVHI